MRCEPALIREHVRAQVLGLEKIFEGEERGTRVKLEKIATELGILSEPDSTGSAV